MYSGNEILDFSASGIPQFPSRLIAKRKETATVLQCGSGGGGGGMAKRNIRQAGGQGGFLYVYIHIHSDESVCVPFTTPLRHRFKSTVAYIINVQLPACLSYHHYHRHRHFVCFYRLRSPFYPFLSLSSRSYSPTTSIPQDRCVPFNIHPLDIYAYCSRRPNPPCLGHPLPDTPACNNKGNICAYRFSYYQNRFFYFYFFIFE